VQITGFSQSLKPILLQKDSTNLFCFDGKQTTFIRKQLELNNAYLEKIEVQDFLVKNLQDRNKNLENQFALYQNNVANYEAQIKLQEQNFEAQSNIIIHLKSQIKSQKKHKKLLLAGIGILAGGLVFQSLKR